MDARDKLRDEIEDRLAEIEIALTGVSSWTPRALRYLRKEVELLLAESREQQDAWTGLTERAQQLATRLRSEDRAAPAGPGSPS